MRRLPNNNKEFRKAVYERLRKRKSSFSSPKQRKMRETLFRLSLSFSIFSLILFIEEMIALKFQLKTEHFAFLFVGIGFLFFHYFSMI